MQSIKDMGMERAYAILRALGAQYIVKTAQGDIVIHGDLKLAEPKVEPDTAKRRPKRRIGHMYMPELQKLQPGESVVIKATDEIDAESLQACMTAWATAHWGKGAYMSAQRDGGVEILRFE